MSKLPFLYKPLEKEGREKNIQIWRDIQIKLGGVTKKMMSLMQQTFGKNKRGKGHHREFGDERNRDALF